MVIRLTILRHRSGEAYSAVVTGNNRFFAERYLEPRAVKKFERFQHHTSTGCIIL
ncbi:hypothetical protein HMPREF0201_00809 [Cedecea davisae DSM 4568]|uniref:Uncharacterized protein n=1 Tax=Cedecea davisae DSM 4568 TaxID=566551 RepID=S3J312_9ENTR|nr:hypothetical protein HMPREF0201_00809 [Cedecea davisae DSM 4568]